NGKKAPTGNLSYDGPPPPPPAPGTKPPKPPAKPLHFDAKMITSFAIAPGGKSAWIAGVGKDGSTFLAYVEDNSTKPKPPGPKAKGSPDVFQLWLDGVLQTGDGSLDAGKVDIKVPSAKP